MGGFIGFDHQILTLHGQMEPQSPHFDISMATILNYKIIMKMVDGSYIFHLPGINWHRLEQHAYKSIYSSLWLSYLQ